MSGKKCQITLNNLDGKADFSKYNGWILTVGELRDRLKPWPDNTLVKLDFDGETPFGEKININMHIANIGNSIEFVNGEKMNLIYLSGTSFK